MSKRSKSGKKIFYISGMIVLLGIAGILLAGFIYNTVSNQNIRHQIATQYNLIRMPSSLRDQGGTFFGQSFLNDNPGTSVYWGYAYAPVSRDATLQEVRQGLTNSFMAAGYTIDKPADPNPNDNLISLDAHNMKLQILATLTADGNSPNSIVTEINIQAYEAGVNVN